jgi:hypothetical protein
MCLRNKAKAAESKICRKFRFHATMCEVAHTSTENRQVIAKSQSRIRRGNVHAMGGIMPRTNLWDRSVPRVELDRRSREARLRFERVDQLFIGRATVMPSRLRRLLYLLGVGRYGGLPQQSEVEELLSNRWPSGLPMRQHAAARQSQRLARADLRRQWPSAKLPAMCVPPYVPVSLPCRLRKYARASAPALF